MSEAEPLRPAVYPGDTDVDDLIARLERETARADAAEAQLAVAREDLAATLARAKQAETDLAAGRDGLQLVIAAAREDGARDYLEFLATRWWNATENTFAAWRAAQGTEAKA